MIKQITGISIQSGSKTFNLYDDIKVAILDFEADRNTQHVALKDYSYIREDDSWQPKDLELVFNTFQDLSNFQEFINEFDKSYLLTFKYGGKEFRTYVAKKSSVISSRNNGAHQKISMTLQQQTPYFVIVSREYILPDGEDETEGVYPFKYPLTYAKAGKTNTFSFGRMDMFNSGDKVSAIKLEIYGGLIVDSAVSIEDYAEYTENSYIPTISAPVPAIVTVNSFTPNRSIVLKNDVGDEINIEQYREFANSRGYLFAPKGEFTIYFRYIRRAVVTIYEQYFQLR